MLIDGTTLADLQVFSSQDGRNGVLGLLDHTSTDLGRRALRRRIASPPDDVAEIRSVQDSVEFLSGLERPIWLDDRVISGVASYLTSPIVVSRASGAAIWIEEAWLRVRYRDVVGELRGGLAASSPRTGRAAPPERRASGGRARRSTPDPC